MVAGPLRAPHPPRVGCRRSVPLPLTVALCAAFFLVGLATDRVWRPPPELADEAVGGGSHARARALGATPTVTQQQAPAVVTTAVGVQPAEQQQQQQQGRAPALAAAGSPSPYPPLEPGASGNRHVDTLYYQVLSWQPRIVYYPGFFPDEHCDHIRELAQKRLAPSSLALRAGDTAEGTKDVRTSQGTFMTHMDDPNGAIPLLEKRIADVTMIPVHHGEPFNVLRYELGQKYDSHYDTFDPESYGPQYSQRMASFLLYLSDWEEARERPYSPYRPYRAAAGARGDRVRRGAQGGETVFPLEGPNGLARLAGIDYRSCAQGLRVKPARKGDAVVFYNMHTNATFDKAALHGGCPVKAGTKWVMTRWLRDKSFGGG